MSMIVAARFQTFDQAALAANKLFAEGFTEDDVHTFYINSAGEHGRYPLGGDRAADPDSKGGHWGAVAGASALGLVFALLGGLIAARLTAPLLIVIAAAGVGAYLGALAGALWIVGRDKRRNPAEARAQENHPPVRAAGVMLALHVPVGQEGLARRVLRESGGHDIERANGRWLDGKWEDFDPLTPPRHVEAPTSVA
ncbi:hypothetical protein [Achromobacter pestifer]|uniref:Glycine zipper family protein n=1 Tax=Achromobacter pestifer TaxID=1353889 RepID=A0A6S6YJX7_9BURK|nr:hypothetical protein [Achromobacter pestifer]CAB3627142.1 hypothetical protein LMG3431_00481 [Achromobacter pestifer]